MDAEGRELIDREAGIAYVYPEVRTRYDARDLCLYALGVGAGPSDLRFVWEGHHDFAPLPSFAVVPAVNTVIELLASRQNPGLRFGLDRLLHGYQKTEIAKSWPRQAELKHLVTVPAIWDRLKYASVVALVRTFDVANGELLAVNELVMTVRGGGGCGGGPGPAAEPNTPPDRPPDAVVEQLLREDQALLYRLSGDVNPLHVDPEAARSFGLTKPILHGLCTFGFAARHVLHEFAKDDPLAFRSIRLKFATPVYPGETLRTEMWREEGTRVVFRCRAKERDKTVLANAAVELRGAG